MTVDVARDLNNPDITNLPATVTINENTLPETLIFTGVMSDGDRRVGEFYIS